MATVDQVLKFREEMYNKSVALVKAKGKDYSGKHHDTDSLFNLTVSETLGIVDTAERGIMVRLADKLMRIISLLDHDGEVDESFEDAVLDAHNYLDYVALKRRERRKPPSFKVKVTGVSTRPFPAIHEEEEE